MQQRQSGSKRALKPHSSKTFGMSGCSWEPCLKAMEQALKILEPSQQEIRRVHLSSLADHLSRAGVPPEEEASLIEALDFCTQEEKEKLLAACKKSAQTTTKRRASQCYDNFPCYLPAKMWEVLPLLQNGNRMEEILLFLFRSLWLRCPGEQTLAKVVAVCVAVDGGVASSFHLHELMEQARSIWKGITSKYRSESEVPEFLLTLPSRKQDLPDKMKELVGSAWEDNMEIPFSAHDLDNLARRVPLRKTNMGACKKSTAFASSASQYMYANPAGFQCTWPTGRDPRQAGPLTNLVIFPPRSREEPRRALSWSEPAANAPSAAGQPRLALPAPEASVPRPESLAERSAAALSSAENLESQDSETKALPPSLITLPTEPTQTKEEEGKMEVKRSVKPEEKKQHKAGNSSRGNDRGFACEKGKGRCGEPSENTGHRRAESAGQRKGESAGQRKSKSKGHEEARSQEPLSRTRCGDISMPTTQEEESGRCRPGNAGDPESAHSLCGTGNVFFHSSVHGQCKGEFYKAKSYLRYWQDSDKKWKMIVGARNSVDGSYLWFGQGRRGKS